LLRKLQGRRAKGGGGVGGMEVRGLVVMGFRCLKMVEMGGVLEMALIKRGCGRYRRSYMYVCMYVSMYIYMYECIYIYIDIYGAI
jgi:hypothetical protein